MRTSENAHSTHSVNKGDEKGQGRKTVKLLILFPRRESFAYRCEDRRL